MALPTGAGGLTERVRFERRSADERGRPLGPWIEHSEVAAGKKLFKGGESVMASRLQGKSPAAFWIRASRAAREIDNTFRLVDARSGRVYRILSAELRESRDFVDILAEAGGTDG